MFQKKERGVLPILRIAEEKLIIEGLFISPFPCNVYLSVRHDRKELLLSFNGALGKHKAQCRKTEEGVEIVIPEETASFLKPHIGKIFVLKETSTPQTYVVSLR